MENIRIPRIVQDTCIKHLMKGRTIGFVPTMGALHEGHLSLIRRARAENDVVVVSIYVNPLQFGPAEDFTRYPRDIEQDIRKIQGLDVDILFLPDDAVMYGPGSATRIEVLDVSERLCGRFRPGHFRGVATVVAKLLNIVSPTRAYFGQKDYQQTVVIRRMARDLNFAVEVVTCPTIREQDGLAMSSRNAYLGPDERKAAVAVYRCLSSAAEAIRAGTRSGGQASHMMVQALSGEPLIGRVDYASVVDPETLEDVEIITGDVIVAAAVVIGTTRLIDNIAVNL